jgi:GNAT superfamily N-acetyltransferase
MKYVAWNDEWLAPLCRLWNQEIGDRFPMREELFRQNSFDDANVLPSGSWIAVDEKQNRVAGFIVAKCWQEQRELVLGKGVGWIQALIVDRQYRQRGIGSALLEKAEAALRQRGVEKILLGSDPWHYFPGIPEEYQDVQGWFERKGYTAGKPEYDLISAEQGEKLPLPQIADVLFRTITLEDKEALLSFFHRCFPGRWEYEAIRYFEKGGIGREFVVIEKAGTIIGFCRINDAGSPFIAQNVYWAPLFAGELGGIGPLGIDADQRKYGYGLAVVQAGAYFLQQRGINRIVIDWTDLLHFYAKLGFAVWKSYRRYYKQIESAGAYIK